MTTNRDGRAITLELHAVSLILGNEFDRVTALDAVDLAVSAGELVAVTGRSGSGKSSLLNVAGGLVRPSAGVVRVSGQPLADLSPTALAAVRRQRIGYVFQDLNLISSLTAAENISLPLELDGVAVSTAREQALEALNAVGLPELAGRFPSDMSGGQRQRVAIARGLVGQRGLLLADEPTGAVDEVTAEGIMTLLRQKCTEGAAALVVTHDPSMAAWADRVIRLRDGRVDSVSTPSLGASMVTQ